MADKTRSETFTLDTARLTTHWRSTAIGLVILVEAAMQTVKFDVAGHLEMTARDWFGLAGGVLAACVGAMMRDAGVTEAKTPDGAVEAVASHETPDDPKNKLVTQ